MFDHLVLRIAIHSGVQKKSFVKIVLLGIF